MLSISENFSIESILPYLALDKKQKKKTSRIVISQLEEIAIVLEMSLKSSKKTDKAAREMLPASETEKPEKKSMEKGKVSYSLFIPAAIDKYDSAVIRYFSKNGTESLDISLQKGEENAGIKIDKPSAEQNYSILFDYDKQRQGYNVVYHADYADRLENARQDFTSRLDKALDLLPKSLMGGILGFTYLGSGKMTRRDDLFGDKALMVDVHEAIHTPDEYETRILTDWMLLKERPKYKK